MTVDKFQTLRKQALQIAIKNGLGPSVRYLKRNGIKPSKVMITEIKLIALMWRRAEENYTRRCSQC